MTAIPASRITTAATPFERMLLQAAAVLDALIAARLERRADPARRRAVAAQTSFAAARRSAEARGAIGILPR